MIAIINYEAGNLASVSNAMERLKASYKITDRHGELEKADGIIFPGVGHAKPAMESLRKNELDIWLKHTDKPVLGICLGMQLLYEFLEESNSEGLGVIPGKLRRFNSSEHKVPHMGWNTFTDVKNHPLLKGFDTGEYFYYVHSYYAPLNDYTTGTCTYINEFASVVCRDNFMGVQFHPEKSGKAGAQLLQNFLSIVNSPQTTG